MAGVSIVLSEGGLLTQKSKLDKTLNSLNYIKNFNSTVCLHEDNIFIGWNKYDEYPIQEIFCDYFIILLEGKIYNKTNSIISTELSKIIKSVEDKNYKYLQNWLQETDGDFLLYIYNKLDGELFILNDILGRIPVYYINSTKGIIISRHLKFITDLLENFKFDDISFAEILLMGFMIGQRTLIKNVNQLAPASLLQTKKRKIDEIKLYNYNFDLKLHGRKSFSENINNISELFSESVNNRFKNSEKNILTLSGGLDSRAVAACLYYNNINFTAVTMKYSSGHEAKDLVIAEKLSRLFNSNWKSIDVSLPKGNDLIELLFLKEGMNSLSTSAILGFYRKVSGEFGNKINFITGDNGDKLIFTIDQPIKKLNSIEELIHYTIKDRAVSSLEEIKNILNFNKDDLYEDLNNVFNSYPEADLSQKFIHFRVLEKPFKYAFQGEDRHRNYFWNISPFWSFPFYNYLMNCSDKIKKKHKTFSAWLQKYSPQAVELEYTNFRSPINSIQGKLFMSFVYSVYPKIPHNFKNLLKTSFFPGNPKIDIDSHLIQCILNQKNQITVSEKLNIPKLDTLSKQRKGSLYTILTLSSAIEFFKDETLTLSEFSNDIFS